MSTRCGLLTEVAVVEMKMMNGGGGVVLVGNDESYMQIAPKCSRDMREMKPPKSYHQHQFESYVLTYQLPPYLLFNFRKSSRQKFHVCLWPGTWLVLLGASQSSVWLQQLANTLVPGAFNALRDNFVTDGRVGGSGRGKILEEHLVIQVELVQKELLDKHWKKDVWKQPQFCWLSLSPWLERTQVVCPERRLLAVDGPDLGGWEDRVRALQI